MQVSVKHIREAIGELERELTVREKVYPNLVAQQKLTQHEADRRSNALRCASWVLRNLAEGEPVNTPAL